MQIYSFIVIIENIFYLTIMEFLKPEELAKILKVSPKTIYLYIKKGQIPALKMGRIYRISPLFVKKISRSPILPSPPKITKATQTILKKTAETYGLKKDDLFIKSKDKRIVTARQLSVYFLRCYEDYSFKEISNLFNISLSTASHAFSQSRKIHLFEKKAEELNKYFKELP